MRDRAGFPGLPGYQASPGPSPPTGRTRLTSSESSARARVIGLRREGLSVYEISTRLTGEGTPLGRTAVSDILREEGFGRLLRGPAPEASTSPATSGRDTRLPAAAVTDFAALPARAHTTMAGLLLAIPDLVALDLPAPAAAAGYPGSKAIPATGYLLALKLTATRRVSHVDDLLTDPAASRCSRACRSCRRRPRSPTTPTGYRMTTSGRSWPPCTRR